MSKKAIGLPSECRKEMVGCMEPQDFSTDKHEVVSLGLDVRDNLVTIRHSRKTSPYPWEVAYGMSRMFFKSFADAMEFCQSSGMEILKGQRNV